MLIKNEISPQKFFFLEYDYNEKLLQKNICVSTSLRSKIIADLHLAYNNEKAPKTFVLEACL